MAQTENKLTSETTTNLLLLLKTRFDKNQNRHQDIKWLDVLTRLTNNPIKLWSLNEMEISGGEPDIVDFDNNSGEYLFFDCCLESPKGRRSICFDPEALEARKEYKPKHSAAGMAYEMGIEILDEAQYRQLQKYGKFDTKTSSWIATPADIRALGGALFADFRYEHVFVYHNGAESYYGARAFRGALRI